MIKNDIHELTRQKEMVDLKLRVREELDKLTLSELYFVLRVIISVKDYIKFFELLKRFTK